MQEDIEIEKNVAAFNAAQSAGATGERPITIEEAKRDIAAEKSERRPVASPAAADVLAPAPAEFERQLEPRSFGQAAQLAKYMHEAKMFSGYGSPQAVLSTVLAGRELGLQAIASLRGFHVIEGKHAPSADLMRALVLRSGRAKYFCCVERTDKGATFETLRHGEPEPVRLSYTIAEGWQAFKPELPEAERRKKWESSAWAKYPANMVTARAGAMLARLVYPDVLFGLYCPEELSA